MTQHKGKTGNGIELRCLVCGAVAVELRGRWRTGRGVCRACGRELPASCYQEQVEAWQEGQWEADDDG